MQQKPRLTTLSKAGFFANHGGSHFLILICLLPIFDFLLPGNHWAKYHCSEAFVKRSVARFGQPGCNKGTQWGCRAIPVCRGLAVSDRVRALADLDGFNSFPDGSAVALGKFDALHKGHATLAAAASGIGQSAWLLSLEGMAEVFGWPERLPLIAPELRSSILDEWGGVQQKHLPFAAIRSLQPDEFVDILADVLRVKAVVCGSNYRFGFRAAGDAQLLHSLGTAAGLKVQVVDLLTHETDQVLSSASVRSLLAEGNIQKASSYLGRPHVVVWKGQAGNALFNPSNQPPGDGIYPVELSVQRCHQGMMANSHKHDRLSTKEALLTIEGGIASLDVSLGDLHDGTCLSTTFLSNTKDRH